MISLMRKKVWKSNSSTLISLPKAWLETVKPKRLQMMLDKNGLIILVDDINKEGIISLISLLENLKKEVS